MLRLCILPICKITLAAAALACLPHSARAYDDIAHNQIIVDAVNYMIDASSDMKLHYIDGSSAVDDYELLQKVLAPHSQTKVESDRAIRRAALLLAKASSQLDYREDVRIELCTFILGCDLMSGLGPVFFTTFSHFLNIPGDGVLFDDSGYNYGWVKKNKECAGGLKDFLANAFIKYSGGTFDPRSDSMIAYGTPLRRGITPDQYNEHFRQDIKYIHFWPITNLAQYWLTFFLDDTSRRRDGIPARLSQFGFVLHAVADTTVPFHAAGLSGCGHVEYESIVEGLYKDKSPFKASLVKEWLVKGSHLTKSSNIRAILIGNGKEAYDGKCQCSGLTCHCPIVDNNGRVSDQLIIQDLTNLATAATVAAIRVGFSQWLAKQSSQLPSIVDYKEPEQNYGAWGNSPWGYSHWSAVPVETPAIKASDPHQEALVTTKLKHNLGGMHSAVADVQSRTISRTAFKWAFNGSVEQAANTVSQFPPVTWNINKYSYGDIGSSEESDFVRKPLKFRPPSISEIENAEGWMKYLGERDRFYTALEVYQTGKVLAALKAKLAVEKNNAVKSEIIGAIADLNKHIDTSLDLLLAVN